MKLYLTKHKERRSGGTSGRAVVTWTWSGDKATISRKLELEIAYVEDSDLPVPEIGDLVTMEDTERLFQGVVMRRTLGSEIIPCRLPPSIMASTCRKMTAPPSSPAPRRRRSPAPSVRRRASPWHPCPAPASSSDGSSPG